MGVFLLLLASTYYPAPSTTLPKHDIESLPVFTAQSNKQRQREADLDRILTSTLQPEHTYLASHDVSAILVHHRRPKALALQLRALSRLAFIREVIVFNVNDHVDLSKADLLRHLPPVNPPALRVLNLPSFIGDQAIWTACSLANHSICYYNDDTTFNPQLPLLYAKLVDPDSTVQRVVTAATSAQVWLYRHFQFENHVDAGFHGGLSPFRSAFFPRVWAKRFLLQLGSTPALVSRDSIVQSSLFFTAWTNTYPDLFLSDLQIVDVEGDVVSGSDALPMRQQQIMIDGLAKFFDALRTQDPALIPAIFPVASSPAPHDARSACHDGTCLFTSSQSPFPHPAVISRAMQRMLPATVPAKHWFELGAPPRPPMRITNARAASFDPHLLTSLNALVAEVGSLSHGAVPVYPTWSDWTTTHSWQLAVDGDDGTCWESHLSVRVGDHFGLELVPPTLVKQVEVLGDASFAALLSTEANRQWEMLVAYQSAPSVWLPVRPLSTSSVTTADGTKQLVAIDAIFKEAIARLKVVSMISRTDTPAVCSFRVLA